MWWRVDICGGRGGQTFVVQMVHLRMIDRGGREKINVVEMVHVRWEGEEWMTNRCSRDSACEKDEGGRGGQMVERGM